MLAFLTGEHAGPRYTSTQARHVLAQVNATLQALISGIRVARYFRQEQRIYDEFKPTNAPTLKHCVARIQVRLRPLAISAGFLYNAPNKRTPNRHGYDNAAICICKWSRYTEK